MYKEGQNLLVVRQFCSQPAYSARLPLAHQQNVIQMVCRWWTDGGLLLDVYWIHYIFVVENCNFGRKGRLQLKSFQHYFPALPRRTGFQISCIGIIAKLVSGLLIYKITYYSVKSNLFTLFAPLDILNDFNL